MSRVIQGLSNCESAQQCVFLCYISLVNDTALEEKYVYFLQIFIWENWDAYHFSLIYFYEHKKLESYNTTIVQSPLLPVE